MGIFDIFTNDNANNAANTQAAYLQQGYNQLAGLFGQGQSALTSNYATAAAPFTSNIATANQGTTALGNALGLNGPQGNAQATQSFWNSPAIQSQLNIGSQNVLRNQAATGQLNSGATNVDLQNLGQQTASQGWNQYINNLQPYLGYGTANASGLAGVQTGLGNQLNSSLMNQGNAAYGMNTSTGNAYANADLANNSASANIWSALMGGGNLLANGLGGSGGISNLLGLGGSAGGSGAGAGGGSIFSDARLKEDISQVGELYDGTNVYAFRYKGDDVPRIGLMAQEVERTRPDAVTEVGGYKAVDYGKATEGARDYAAAFGKFLKAA